MIRVTIEKDFCKRFQIFAQKRACALSLTVVQVLTDSRQTISGTNLRTMISF